MFNRSKKRAANALPFQPHANRAVRAARMLQSTVWQDINRPSDIIYYFAAYDSATNGYHAYEGRFDTEAIDLQNRRISTKNASLSLDDATALLGNFETAQKEMGATKIQSLETYPILAAQIAPEYSLRRALVFMEQLALCEDTKTLHPIQNNVICGQGNFNKETLQAVNDYKAHEIPTHLIITENDRQLLTKAEFSNRLKHEMSKLQKPNEQKMLTAFAELMHQEAQRLLDLVSGYETFRKTEPSRLIDYILFLHARPAIRVWTHGQFKTHDFQRIPDYSDKMGSAYQSFCKKYGIVPLPRNDYEDLGAFSIYRKNLDGDIARTHGLILLAVFVKMAQSIKVIINQAPAYSYHFKNPDDNMGFGAKNVADLLEGFYDSIPILTDILEELKLIGTIKISYIGGYDGGLETEKTEGIQKLPYTQIYESLCKKIIIFAKEIGLDELEINKVRTALLTPEIAFDVDTGAMRKHLEWCQKLIKNQDTPAHTKAMRLRS